MTLDAARPGRAPSPAPSPTWTRSGRLLIGAFINFVFVMVLYGVTQAVQLIAMAVICTAGIALIPILFLSWLVGWVVTSVWDAARRPPSVAPS